MRIHLVYDLPIRIFHWVFAGLFLAIFFIAKTIDDESVVFSYHMLAGLTLAFVVILRILWGFCGTQYSRFASFSFKPKDLVGYFAGILAGDRRKWTGHNPASSWATIFMFALTIVLAATGILMATGNKEAFEDVHELAANAFLIVVILHVAGVVLHGVRHRDGIALSMVDGRKMNVPVGETAINSRLGVAAFFLVLLVLFSSYLVRNFTSPTRTLKVFGTTLQLGEGENDDNDDNDDDDDD